MSGINARLDLSRVVKHFGLTASVQIIRENAGQYIDGRWTAGPESNAATACMSLQPFRGDRNQLPEGIRYAELWSAWSTSEIKPVMRSDGTSADMAMFEGKKFRFYDFRDWHHNGNYWQAVMAKVDQ